MDVRVSLPEILRDRIDAVVASDGYASTADYLREIVEHDLAERASVDESPAHRRWLKAEIDQGLASGILDQDPRHVIEDIIAERHARRG